MFIPILAEIPAASGLDFIIRELSLSALFLLQAGGAVVLFVQGAYLSVMTFFNKDKPSYWWQFAFAVGITVVLFFTEALWASSIVR